MPDKECIHQAYLLCGILQGVEESHTINMLVADAPFAWHFTIFSACEFPLCQVDCGHPRYTRIGDMVNIPTPTSQMYPILTPPLCCNFEKQRVFAILMKSGAFCTVLWAMKNAPNFIKMHHNSLFFRFSKSQKTPNWEGPLILKSKNFTNVFLQIHTVDFHFAWPIKLPHGTLNIWIDFGKVSIFNLLSK